MSVMRACCVSNTASRLREAQQFSTADQLRTSDELEQPDLIAVCTKRRGLKTNAVSKQVRQPALQELLRQHGCEKGGQTAQIC